MSEDDWIEEERQELERMIQVLTERRDSIASDPDGYIIGRMDMALDSYTVVEERLGTRPNISMWEHLHGLIVKLEEEGEAVVSEEVARLESRISEAQERLEGLNDGS